MPVLNRENPADIPRIEDTMMGKLNMLHILYSNMFAYFKVRLWEDNLTIYYSFNPDVDLNSSNVKMFKQILNCYLLSFCDNFWVEDASACVV